MKKFRVKNLTVAVNPEVEFKPTPGTIGGPIGPICPRGGRSIFTLCPNGRTLIPTCPPMSVACNQFTPNCGFTDFPTIITGGGCGINFSTLPPTDFTMLVEATPEITDKLELIESLKADLNLAVANLEASQKDLSESAKPQTLDEAKAVEANLEAALKEVKALKKGLK